MRCAIATVSTKDISDLFSITCKYMQNYANSAGADFIHFDESTINTVKYQHPKYYVISISEIKGYDRILFLDADIFVKPSSPNIFEMFPDNKYVYAYDEMELRNRIWKKRYESIILSQVKGTKLPSVTFKREHYNGGMMLFPASECSKLFRMPPWKVTDNKYLYPPFATVKQQPWRNYCIATSGLKVIDIGRKWDHLPSSRSKTNVKNSYFIHLTGFPGWRGGQYEKLNYLRKMSKDCGIDQVDLSRINTLLKNKRLGNWRVLRAKKTRRK